MDIFDFGWLHYLRTTFKFDRCHHSPSVTSHGWYESDIQKLGIVMVNLEKSSRGNWSSNPNPDHCRWTIPIVTSVEDTATGYNRHQHGGITSLRWQQTLSYHERPGRVHCYRYVSTRPLLSNPMMRIPNAYKITVAPFYNTVVFLHNICKGLPIARDVECILWVLSLIPITHVSVSPCIWYSIWYIVV